MISPVTGTVASAEADDAKGLTVWFTGLSSAGKTTISQALYDDLHGRGHGVEWLDGDVIRQRLSKGLGFSKDDRDENIRRIGFVAELLTRHGVIVLVSAVSPYREVRDEMRQRFLMIRRFSDRCFARRAHGRRRRNGQVKRECGIRQCDCADRYVR